MGNDIDLIKKQLKDNIQKLVDAGSLKEAKELIKQYKSIAQDDVEAYSMDAVVLIMEEKFDQAEQVLREGLSIDEDNFDLNYNLGYVYEKNEKFNLALDCYKKARISCENMDIENEINKIIDNICKIHKYDLVKLENNKNEFKKVLFIQSIPDIRTNKIAQVLCDKNIQVDLMYLAMHPKNVYKGSKFPYKNIFKFKNINGTINFINKSDYDILISSNEPDYLSALLETVNKPIIHDCHDMMSLRGDITNEQIIIEYLANSNCDGNIYVTSLVKKMAKQKFNLNNRPIMILDNYVLKNQLPTKFLNKLSNFDEEIHCVYEGGLTNFKGHHRNIQDVFVKLAKNKIHVHYYASFENSYYRKLAETSKYLHCEGTKEPSSLIEDMTKYDIGLAILNVTERNKAFLDTTFPNKAWEYLAAGLPILFSDLISFREFLNVNNVGEILKLNKNLKNQIKRVKNINISKEYLRNNKLCMDDFSDNIIDFLKKVKKSKQFKMSSRTIGIINKNHNSLIKKLNSILIITPNMDIGGAEEYTINKAKWLVEHGYKVTVVSKGGQWVKRLIEVGIRHYKIPWIAFEDPDLLNKSELNLRIEILKKIIDAEGVDIVEGNNLYPGVYGYKLCKKYKIPFLFNVLSQVDFILVKKYVNLLIELNSKNLYYTMSKGCNNDIEKSNKIVLQNCKVIPIIINSNDKLVIGKKNYILTVCRMTLTKAYVFYLVQEFTNMCLNKKLYNYNLVIVGDGPNFNKLKIIVKNCNNIIKENNCFIDLKGYVYGEKLQILYANCDIYIGMGTTALSAASYKKPVVIATYYPNDITKAYGYFIDKYETISIGEIVSGMKKDSYENYMYSLIQDNKLYTKVALNGFNIIKSNYDINIIMDKWIKNYELIINNNINL